MRMDGEAVNAPGTWRNRLERTRGINREIEGSILEITVAPLIQLYTLIHSHRPLIRPYYDHHRLSDDDTGSSAMTNRSTHHQDNTRYMVLQSRSYEY